MRLSAIPPVLAALAVAAGAAGCGTKTDRTQTPVDTSATIAVPPTAAASIRCLATAQSTGAFKAAGVAVSFIPAQDTAASLEMLNSGRALLTVSTPKILATQRDGGAPYLSVAKLTRVPIQTGSTPKAHAATANSIPATTPTILMATRDTVSSDGEILRRLLQAVGRSCRNTPTKLTASQIKTLKARASALQKKHRTRQAAAVKARLAPYVYANTASGSNPWGWQPPAEWAALVASLRRSGTIKGAISPDTLYTNEFLAGQGT